MGEKSYITIEERKRCQSVIAAFAELYELTDTVVADVKKYGFVKLQYYREPHGFEIMQTFTDSGELFEKLWQDWFEEQVLMIAEGTPLEELEYEEIFEQLSTEQQAQILSKKSYFAEKSGIQEIKP